MCDECYEVEGKYGIKRRYKKGSDDICHCLSEPAIQYSDGDWTWFKNGKVHREDGHAQCWNDVYYFWLEGTMYNEEDYWNKIKQYRKEKLEEL